MSNSEVLGEPLPFDERIVPQGWEGRVVSVGTYVETHGATIKDYEHFWLSIARELEWFSYPTKAFEPGEHPNVYRWFPDGLLNLSYLCVDRHVRTWRRNKVAIRWEGEPVDDEGRPIEKRTLTYLDLYTEVNRLAYAIKKKIGLKKGDTATIYMPMVPELPMLMLALARIGVVFSVVFSGFSPEALTARMSDMESRTVFTANGGYRRGRFLDLLSNVEKAAELYDCLEQIIVLERVKGHSSTSSKLSRITTWSELLSDVPVGVKVDPEPLESTSPLYVLYTSGTTGKPKGIIHDNGGYAVLLHATMKWVFDVRDEDVFWCTADIGWVTGHSYVVFGPLIHGATIVMYEGAPDYPRPDRWWEIIERYRVSILYTTPTAVRMLKRYGDENVLKHDLSSLRLIHSVGEPINPSAWRWLFEVVGGGRCPVGSTWWMTETGGILISHTPGHLLVPLKPGTNGLPIPGIEVDVVDENGRSLPSGKKGYLIVKRPHPGMPGPPTGMWGDPRRYHEVYFKRFGVFYTGDYAIRDEDGYIWVLGRADEVLKVAGHRLGTYEIESCLVSHPKVVEAAVVGVPDEVKGEVPIAYVVLKEGVEKTGIEVELKKWVREKLGPIAEPKSVFVVSKLPKTRSGKIMRRLILAVAAGRELGDVSTLEDEAAVDEVKEAYARLVEELERSRSG